MRRALNLAVKMRALRLIPPMNLTAIDREVQAFDTMLEKVWGFSAGTRRKHRDMVRRLLVGCVRDGRVDMADLTSSHIRKFVLAGREWKPATIRNYAVSIRCYLRYRTLLGDDVRQLKKAIPAPAMKTPAKLQTGFSPAELERLLEVSAEIGRTRKRVHAIVRCLADLGMRSIEVTRLTLDDIDWEKGLIWVRSKSRRSDPMPLPFPTGEAIADYILHERQSTPRREVFVRHVAPFGEPITPRAVQRSVYAVYERLGWDCTRVHIFRHTIASRLVNGAVPLKQVADIMRHRSVVTTAGYARVDQTRLAVVALPWPGACA
ncbi:tyrosine-type recombinase/integrase [Rhizobium sp. Rhizsp42]|uniref:tyrosine-type recombinase/integrase n=1 Tax=Rhizobium sp. Rhizsp42 TaxID=3243034 RepID=UPI0039AF1BAE